MAGKDCIEAMKREAVMLEKNLQQTIARFEKHYGVSVTLMDSASGDDVVIPKFLEVNVAVDLSEARRALAFPGTVKVEVLE